MIRLAISNRRAQATLEYAGLIGLVVLALLAFSMKDYIRRAIMGRMRQDISRTWGEEQYVDGNTYRDLEMRLNESYGVKGGI